MRTCILVVALCLLASLAAVAQPPDTLWSRTLGNAVATSAWGVAVADDGATYVVGSQSPGIGIIYKLDMLGDTLWTYRASGTGTRVFYGVAATADGGCIATGRAIGADTSGLLIVRMQPGGIPAWSRVDNVENVTGNAVLPLADGGFVVAGYARTDANQVDACLRKVSSTGSTVWSRIYSIAGVAQRIASVAPATNGFILSGNADFVNQGHRDALLIRTTQNGDTVWRRAFSFGSYAEAYSAYQAVDGGFVVGGWGQAPAILDNNMLIFKTTSAGASLWSHEYGIHAIDIAWSMAQTPDGGFVLGGYALSGHFAPTLLQLSPDGDSVWTVSFPGTTDAEFRSVIAAPDGGLVAVGYRYVSSSISNAYVVRLGAASGVRGTITDGEGEGVPAVRIAAIGTPYWAISGADGQFVFSLSPGTYDLALSGQCIGSDTLRAITILEDSIRVWNPTVHLNSARVPQTSINPVVHNHIPQFDTLHIYNTGAGVLTFTLDCLTQHPPLPWLSVSPQHGVIASGDSLSVAVRVDADTTDDGIYDYWGQIDVHLNTCPDSVHRVVVVASVEEVDGAPAALPTSLSLSAAPNPFNPSTVLDFDLPKTGRVSLAVYDLTGRIVCTLADGSLDAGAHRVVFDGRSLASGLYIARLSTPTATLTRKLLLIR